VPNYLTIAAATTEELGGKIVGLFNRGAGSAWDKELALEMLGDAGFTDVAVNELDHDELNYFCVWQK